jgi:hypothetical protein
MENYKQADLIDESQFSKELIEETEKPKAPAEAERISESLYALIIKMTVSEKIKLATVGNREARNILIKDPNRIVIMAVMNSPKLKEEDVLSYATNRSLSDEVVNQISLKREWLQNYKIKLALIKNPKTHPTVSLKLLNHILEKDLINIAKDKNVNPLVSRQALRVLDKKGKL